MGMLSAYSFCLFQVETKGTRFVVAEHRNIWPTAHSEMMLRLGRRTQSVSLDAVPYLEGSSLKRFAHLRQGDSGKKQTGDPKKRLEE
jgi:hypothetical protein